MTPEFIAALGFIVTALLGLNAYFIRDLVDSINQVKIQTALLVEKAVNGDSRIKTLEQEVFKLRERNHSMTTELGNRISIMEFRIEELK